MKVRCSGCKTWVEKDGTVPYGLGYCCDENCRWKAIERRRERISEQQQKIERRGYTIAPPPQKTGTRGQASPEKRRYIQQRDGRRCRMCGTNRNLHVHHIRYRSEGGDHHERNLITLCLTDHDLVHSNKRRWQPILTETMRYHYDEELFLSVPEAERRMTDVRSSA